MREGGGLSRCWAPQVSPCHSPPLGCSGWSTLGLPKGLFQPRVAFALVFRCSSGSGTFSGWFPNTWLPPPPAPNHHPRTLAQPRLSCSSQANSYTEGCFPADVVCPPDKMGLRLPPRGLQAMRPLPPLILGHLAAADLRGEHRQGLCPQLSIGKELGVQLRPSGSFAASRGK